MSVYHSLVTVFVCLFCCINEFVLAVVEHLRASWDHPSASALTSSSHRLCESQMKERNMQGNLVPLSQRFLFHVLKIHIVQAAYSLIEGLSIWLLSVWESIRFGFIIERDVVKKKKKGTLKNANTKFLFFLLFYLLFFDNRLKVSGFSYLKISNFTIIQKALGDFFFATIENILGSKW